MRRRTLQRGDLVDIISARDGAIRLSRNPRCRRRNADRARAMEVKLSIHIATSPEISDSSTHRGCLTPQRPRHGRDHGVRIRVVSAIGWLIVVVIVLLVAV